MTLNKIITYFANNCCFSKANLKTRRNKRTHSFTDKQSHNDTIRLEEDFFNHLKKKKKFLSFFLTVNSSSVHVPGRIQAI